MSTTRHFGERDGLPNRRVYALQADNDGFVWIYTLSGIVRYDGREIRKYHLDDVDLSRDHVQAATSMGLTPEGQVWIGIKTGQVFIYNSLMDRFDKRFDFRDHARSDIRIYDVAYDGLKMVFCTSDGIYVADGDSLSCPALKGSAVNSVISISPTDWYAATDHGLFNIKANEDCDVTISLIPGSSGGNFRNLAFSGGKLFAGSFANGVHCYDPATQRFNRILPEAPNVPVNVLAVINDSTLYAGFDGSGVYVIDTSTLESRRHISNDHIGGLSANTITDIGIDCNNGLWISTSTHGINYIAPGDNLCEIETHGGANSLPSDYVMSLFIDSDGDIWYGTDNGLSMKDKCGAWHHYLTRSHLADMNILAITQSADGTIWAGGYGSGLWQIDKARGMVSRMDARSGNRGAGTEYIFNIYADGEDIWFGGIEGPLTRYSRDSDTYEYFPVECVGDMIRTADGTLHITGCEGIGTLNPGDTAITWSRQIGSLSLSHPTRFVQKNALTGDLWYATDGEGILIHDYEAGNASRLPIENIVSSGSIDGLVQDSQGRIWFCTESELFYVNPHSGRIVNMSGVLPDGNDVQIISGAITIRPDGKIMLGTSEGAITVNPDASITQNSALQLIFTDLYINHERVEPGSKILPAAINGTDKIVLSHDDNNITISFSSIDFSENRNISYQWMLEGRDDEWWSAGKNLMAEFRDLPAGKYIFTVRAVGVESGDVVAQRSISIEVRPPFWLTWWAIIIYAIILAVTAIIVLKYMRRRQRERRIADKLQSFFNIVHDLRTPLTLIKAPLSEVEGQENLPDDTRRNIGLAMKNVDRLLGMVGRLLDLRRESNHSDCLNISEVSLHDYLEAKAAEYRVAAMQKKLTIDIDADENLPLVKMDTNKISHVLDNLLSNAIKYTFAGGITLKGYCDKNNWSISISDTGIGIPHRDRRSMFVNQFRGANAIATDELGSGMGLLIVHRLCRLHKGTVKVVSEENKGTTFILTFPMNMPSISRRLPQPMPDEPAVDEKNDDNGKDTIVIIDDDKEILEYLCSSLSSTYNVVQFVSASDAMERIPEINPDIVISDVRLHGISGFELCQKLKSSVATSHIPVILLSGLSERQNIILGLESGANDYIVKPFDISVLRLRLRNILNSRRPIVR